MDNINQTNHRISKLIHISCLNQVLHMMPLGNQHIKFYLFYLNHFLNLHPVLNILFFYSLFMEFTITCINQKKITENVDYYWIVVINMEK